MADRNDMLIELATDAITANRDIVGPYPAGALARSAVEALLAPENRDALLGALGARHIGYKVPLSSLLHDDPRREPPSGAVPVYKIPYPVTAD